MNEFKIKNGFLSEGDSQITGSLDVSSSITTNTFTASNATISGNVTVLGTASINTLIVNQTQLSTGSNQLGDASNDTQTLYGSVIIPTGSLTVTGSLNVTGGITGSLLGTASYATTASYALTSSYSTNIAGTTNYISKFTGTNSLGNSVIFESGSNIGIGTTTPGYPLHINRDTTSNYIQLSGNSNKGLFATGAGLLAFDTSGNFRIYTGGVNERIIVDSTGNLGVGTLSPTARLDIRAPGALSTDIAFRVRNSANTLDIIRANGAGDVFMGEGAGRISTGLYNSFFGNLAAYNNSTGTLNTANGSYALYSNTTGDGSTVIGAFALGNNTTGSSNIALGFNSARYIADGTTSLTVTNNSVYIGANTKALANNQTNQIVIGHEATGLGSNTAVLGNDSITTTALKGNVGIGTTSPSYKLEVAGDIKSTTAYVNDGTTIVRTIPTSGIGYFGTQTNHPLAIQTNSDEKVRITAAGNVGIGTTSPSQKLDVNNGHITTYNSSTKEGKITFNNGAGAVRYDQLTQKLHLVTTTSDRLTIDGSGNVGIGTSSPSSVLSLQNPTIGGTVLNLKANGTTGQPSVINLISGYDGVNGNSYIEASFAELKLFASNGSGDPGSKLTFYTFGSEQMRIDNSGNVGIGTTTPNAKLHVNGNTTITGSLTVIDSTLSSSIDSTSRLLWDNDPNSASTPTSSLDWNNRILMDTSATLSVGWADRKLYDSAGNESLSYRTRTLFSAAGSSSLSWANDTFVTSNAYQQDIKSTTTQDAVSLSAVSSDTYLGDIIAGVVGTVTPPVDGELCYLSTAGKWETYKQTFSSGSYGQMVGLVFNVDGTGGTCQVLLEGHVLINGVGTTGEPTIQLPGYGKPVYLRGGTILGQMSTTIPTSGIVQILGHCYYQNTTNADYWMMKFKPSPDWVEL